MIPFETILWDVLMEYTADPKESGQLLQRVQTTGVYGLAYGEYEADHDEAKAKRLLRDAITEAMHKYTEQNQNTSS